MPKSKQEMIRAVVRVSSGNFLEMYDFMVFGYYAAAIGRAFFPTGNEFASLMLSLMTFGVGFLMRPLGAIVLGAYTDHHGRRKGLMLSLTLMSIGIVSIACVPGYAVIGFVAPLLVVIGRPSRAFPQVWSWVACRSICLRLRLLAIKGSMLVGSPEASSARLYLQHPWV